MLLKKYIKRHIYSPPSPIDQALNQLVKGCELAMHGALLLTIENEKLRTENQRQKRKRAQKRSYLAKGGILTGAKAQYLIKTQQESRTEAVASILGE